MRNPWVHDDVSDAAGSGYDGRVTLLATLIWGLLFVVVGGFVFLSGSGSVDLTGTGTASTVVTSVVLAVALALVLPVLLKLLVISRLLATLAFLVSGWALGRFLWTREAERLVSVVAASETLAEATETVRRLTEATGGIESIVDWLAVAIVSS